MIVGHTSKPEKDTRAIKNDSLSLKNALETQDTALDTADLDCVHNPRMGNTKSNEVIQGCTLPDELDTEHTVAPKDGLWFGQKEGGYMSINEDSPEKDNKGAWEEHINNHDSEQEDRSDSSELYNKINFTKAKINCTVSDIEVGLLNLRKG